MLLRNPESLICGRWNDQNTDFISSGYLRGVIVKAMGCGIVISEFKPFEQIHLGKV